MIRSGWLSILVLLANCGDGGGSSTIDAPMTADATGNDATEDAATCPMGIADHPTFWATLCDAADTCGWLTSGHAELEFDEATCNARHATEPDPSAQVGYLAGFEARIHAAASCLGCQSLVDAYFRPDLESLFCGHLVRCSVTTDMACRTQYQATAAMPGSRAKFDYACPRYCMEALAADAPCANVMACLMACN